MWTTSLMSSEKCRSGRRIHHWKAYLSNTNVKKCIVPLGTLALWLHVENCSDPLVQKGPHMNLVKPARHLQLAEASLWFTFQLCPYFLRRGISTKQTHDAHSTPCSIRAAARRPNQPTICWKRGDVPCCPESFLGLSGKSRSAFVRVCCARLHVGLPTLIEGVAPESSNVVRFLDANAIPVILPTSGNLSPFCILPWTAKAERVNFFLWCSCWDWKRLKSELVGFANKLLPMTRLLGRPCARALMWFPGECDLKTFASHVPAMHAAAIDPSCTRQDGRTPGAAQNKETFSGPLIDSIFRLFHNIGCGSHFSVCDYGHLFVPNATANVSA